VLSKNAKATQLSITLAKQRKADGVPVLNFSAKEPYSVALSRAYGVKALRVNSPSCLKKIPKKTLASGLMCVIEVVEDFAELPVGRY